MRKLKLLLMAAFMLSAHFLFAQSREITGKVTDEKGNPLIGATVNIKNTRTGTSTAPDGSFKLDVSPGSVLVISSVGYLLQEVTIGNKNNLLVSLKPGDQSLTEVVVTAMGVRREKKALGYAVTTIDKGKVEERSQGDVVRILNGKIPGVDIGSTSGISGSGTNILIRGLSTINGNSTPLFVVDNVPFDASTNAQSSFVLGNQTSSRFLDLDPNNIESISVLKGLAATTLYGERGRNGVILITTKNASTKVTSNKAEITVTQSLFANTLANLPTWQNTYGGGFNQSAGFQFFSNWGAAFLNPPTMVLDPYDGSNHSSTLASKYAVSFPDRQGVQIPVVPYPNNVKDFFRTGWVNTSSINIAGSPSRNISLSATYTYFNDKGFVPGNNLRKHNFGFGGNAKLSDKFTLTSSINFAYTDYLTPPNSVSFGSGPSGNAPGIFTDVLYTPRGIDLMNWPFEFSDGGSAYYRSSNDIQNPRWTAKYVKSHELILRTFGAMSLNYEILPGLNLLYRIGLDDYSDDNTLQSPKGGVEFPTGIYRTVNERNTSWNHNLIGSYSHRFSSNFDLSANFGADFYISNYDQSGIYSENQLVFNVWNHNNFINHSNRGEDGRNLNYTSENQQKGVFAEATGGFKDFLYATIGARNSWVSTLEKNHNHELYPSGSVSFVPTSAIDALKSNKWINYMKLRFGYGTSARFPESPYTTRPSLNINSTVFATPSGTIVNSNTIPNLLPNPDLKPELLREIEIGMEGTFIDRRLNLDITLYRRKATDQILFQDLDPSTGYTSVQTNGGDVVNKGIEIGAGLAILRGKSVNWSIEGTFTLNRNKVTRLPEGVDKINVAGYTDLGGFAVVGQPLGVIEGYYVERYNDPKTGPLIVDGNGDYLTSTDIAIIGNPNPKFKTSASNIISYKGVTFRMQWDFTYGGDIYSNTIRTLYARGLTKDTEADRYAPYVLPGVKQDGTPNDIQNDMTDIYFNSIGFGPYDRSIFDATVIRLREASLSYSLPQKLLNKTPFGSVSITVSGENLWYNAPNTPKYMNFDPEVSGLGAGSYRGFDFLNGPSSKRMGASLRISF